MSVGVTTHQKQTKNKLIAWLR